MSFADVPTPNELAPFFAKLKPSLAPVEIWLFGSRARGDARSDSDWDLLAVVSDDAPESHTDPVIAWRIAREADPPVTLLVTRRSELAEIWGCPNTIGYDIADHGVRLRVD